MRQLAERDQRAGKPEHRRQLGRLGQRAHGAVAGVEPAGLVRGMRVEQRRQRAAPLAVVAVENGAQAGARRRVERGRGRE